MSRWAYILATLLLTGCICHCDPIPDQEEALNIVWVQTYSETVHQPPGVEWRDESSLNCGLRDGHFHGWHMGKYYGDPNENGVCIAGVYWSYPNVIQVAHLNDFKFSESSFAHELWHAHLEYTTGDPDPEHWNPGFYPDGAVEIANNNLAASGR